MKKLLFVLVALIIIPFHVKAIDTEFDSDTCTLTVSGEEAGHEAMVSLFEDDEFKALKTDTISNGGFRVDFRLVFDEEQIFKVVVTDENGENKLTKENVNIPACEASNLPDGKVSEVFDGEGNSLIMNSDTTGFDEGDYLEIIFIDEEDIDYMIDNSDDDAKEYYIFIKNTVLNNLGNYRSFLSVLDIYVYNDEDEDKYLGYYDGDYLLNIFIPKEVFDELKGLKVAYLDDELNISDPLDYEYDEENEILTVTIDGIENALIVYIDNDYLFLDNTDNQTYNVDEDDTITLRVDADYSKFKGVKFDDEIMALDTYESSEGSTIIIIKRSFLKNLSLGSHTITVLFADGSASTTLTVVNNETNPGTSDNVIYYIGAFILSIIAFAGVVIFKKKKLN